MCRSEAAFLPRTLTLPLGFLSPFRKGVFQESLGKVSNVLMFAA